MSREPKLEALQVLRAAAALAVMLFHGTQLLEARLGGEFLASFFRPGFHGVDVFFVLSGFIIHYTAKPTLTRREFLAKRFIRLFPVYWVVTALLVAAYALAPTPEMAHKGDPAVWLKSALLLPAPRHVVGVAWTLVYEVWFYALFGLLFFRRPALLYAALGLWSAVAATNAFVVGWQPEAFALTALLDPIVVEFLLGCGAAALFARGPSRLGPAFLAAGLFGLGAAWWTSLHGHFLPREIAYGVPSALLVYGAAHVGRRLPRVLTYLGDASYSIYLLHATAISALLKIVARLGWNEALAGAAGGMLVLAGAGLACCAFYEIVERPLLAFCRRRWLGRKPVGALRASCRPA
jgi:peptidoglycan/LPS O-acetylase OafA/YrhL